MSNFVINVQVNTTRAVRETRRARAEINRLGDSANRLRNSLNNAFAFLGVAVAIVQLKRLTDTFTTLENKIRNVTDSEAQLTVVSSDLFNIAQKTRSGLAATANLYTRVALSTKNLGTSQQETLNFTKSLNEAILLSGATAVEAEAGLIQLSQGLASGRLQGDELRSVLEQLPVVADVIAKGMGITRGELREFGAQGKVTAQEVLKAFREAREELENKFARAIPTIAQSLVVLDNALIRTVGGFDKAFGASSGLALIIITIAENMETLIRVAAGLTIALGAVLAVKGVQALEIAFNRLGRVMLANPLVAFGAVVLLIVSQLVVFSDQIFIVEGKLTTLQDLGVATFNKIGSALEVVGVFFGELFSNLLETMGVVVKDINISFLDIVKGAATLIDTMLGLFVGIVRSIAFAWGKLPEIMSRTFEGIIKRAIIGASNLNNTLQKYINELSQSLGGGALFDVTFIDTTKANDEFELGMSLSKELGASMGNIISEEIANSLTATKGLEDLFNEADKIGTKRREFASAKLAREEAARARLTESGSDNSKPLKTAGDKNNDRLKDRLKQLAQEIELLQLGNKERVIQAGLFDLEAAAKRDLTETEEKFATNLLTTIESLKVQNDVLQDIKGSTEELIVRKEALIDLFIQGKLSALEYARGLDAVNLAQSQDSIDKGTGTFADGFRVELDEMLKATESFASKSGKTFATFFKDIGKGFAESISGAIVFGDSISQSLGNVANAALGQLLQSMIQLSIEFAIAELNASSLGTSLSSMGGGGGLGGLLGSLFGGGGGSEVAAGAGAIFGGGSAFGFAQGGPVSGAGTGTSDSIVARLSDGEYVMPADKTAQNRELLDAMREGRMPKFKSGGVVNAGASTAANNSEVAQQGSKEGSTSNRSNNAISIVNVIDPSIVGNFLQTSDGERTLINVIENNAAQISALIS